MDPLRRWTIIEQALTAMEKEVAEAAQELPTAQADGVMINLRRARSLAAVVTDQAAIAGGTDPMLARVKRGDNRHVPR